MLDLEQLQNKVHDLKRDWLTSQKDIIEKHGENYYAIVRGHFDSLIDELDDKISPEEIDDAADCLLV